MLTKAQKAYADEVFARAGKTSPALQQQIKRIRAARSEDELEWLFSSDANVVRPKEEAELLCVVMLTRLDELHSSINAASQKSEQPITKNPVNAEIRISRIIGVEEIPSIGNRGKASQIIKSAIFPPLLNVDEDIDSILADRSGESTLSESASDASIRDDRVSVKNQESNSRINIASPEYNQHSITSRPVKVEGPSAFVKRIEKTEQNPNGLFTAVKAIAIIAILFFAVVALLSALFDKKHSGQPIIYYVVSVTIKGHYYEKEATQQDFNSGFVTFEDGTRVPWSAVKSTEIKIYPDELTNAINVINTIPSKQ